MTQKNETVSEIQTYNPQETSQEIIEVVSNGFLRYLEQLGLPSQSILVETKQRQRAVGNIEGVLADLSPSQRESAYYLSKFIAACMMGLFDAALNYLWNEIIQNLRKKVAYFDINYFYDTAIQDTNKRSKFQDEKDLINLGDSELVAGCEETGIITKYGYKHLDFIRDMRNHASAAHPNHNKITGLNLASWLDTCIEEVFSKEPDSATIEIKTLLNSLREENLSSHDIPPIAEGIRKLPQDLIHSLLRTVFGMYTDINIEADVRRNINLIATEIWKVSRSEIRYEIALKHSSFEVNGKIGRKKLAYEFLEKVQGLSYLHSDTLALELNKALDALLTAHNGWHNFYNEPIPAELVKSRVPENGKIPKSSIRKYVIVLTICRIGNEYGVSNSAQEIYDELIGNWSNDEARNLITLLNEDYKLQSKLQFSSCQNNLQQIIEVISENVTDKLIQDMFDFIKKFPKDKLDSIHKDRRFKEKISNI